MTCKNDVEMHKCLKDSDFFDLSKKQDKPLFNGKIWEDALTISKNFKLYPSDEWSSVITFLIFDNDKAKSFLDKCYFTDPMLLSGIKNCSIVKRLHDLTGESELMIKIYPDTSLDDIKISWKAISKEQALLRGEHKKKRWYPLRNIEIAKKIQQLKKDSISDWEVQEKLFGEITDINFGKEERRRCARIRQTRKRYKI